MTPRASWYIVLLGLVLGAGCAIPFYFIGNQDPLSDNADMGIVVLGLTSILGGTIMVVGLGMVIATAWPGKQRHR